MSARFYYAIAGHMQNLDYFRLARQRWAHTRYSELALNRVSTKLLGKDDLLVIYIIPFHGSAMTRRMIEQAAASL